MSKINIRQVGKELGEIRITTDSDLVEYLNRLSDEKFKTVIKVSRLCRKAHRLMRGD